MSLLCLTSNVRLHEYLTTFLLQGILKIQQHQNTPVSIWESSNMKNIPKIYKDFKGMIFSPFYVH